MLLNQASFHELIYLEHVRALKKLPMHPVRLVALHGLLIKGAIIESTTAQIFHWMTPVGISKSTTVTNGSTTLRCDSTSLVSLCVPIKHVRLLHDVVFRWSTFICCVCVVLFVIVDSVTALQRPTRVADNSTRIKNVRLAENVLRWTSVTIFSAPCVESRLAFGTPFFTHYG